jgi:hypothetical protein
MNRSSPSRAARRSRSARACCFSTVLTAIPRRSAICGARAARSCAGGAPPGIPRAAERSRPGAARAPGAPSPAARHPATARPRTPVRSSSRERGEMLRRLSRLIARRRAAVKRSPSGRSTCLARSPRDRRGCRRRGPRPGPRRRLPRRRVEVPAQRGQRRACKGRKSPCGPVCLQASVPPLC